MTRNLLPILTDGKSLRFTILYTELIPINPGVVYLIFHTIVLLLYSSYYNSPAIFHSI